MSDIFPGPEPKVTDALILTGYLGSRAELWAYAGRVIIELTQGIYEAECHMTVPEAKRLRANLDATIAAAELLEIGDAGSIIERLRESEP